MSESSSGERQTLVQRSGPPHPMDEDYWPMLASAIAAALLAAFSQLLMTVYMALQWNVTIDVRRWNAIPYLAFITTRDRFETILYWSAIGTACFLILFSVSAFFGRRLQIKAGRLFAWLDISLIGFAILIRRYIFESDVGATNLAWLLFIGGLGGFLLGFLIIRNLYVERKNQFGAYYSHAERRFI